MVNYHFLIVKNCDFDGQMGLDQNPGARLFTPRCKSVYHIYPTSSSRNMVTFEVLTLPQIQHPPLDGSKPWKYDQRDGMYNPHIWHSNVRIAASRHALHGPLG